jgi:hypothetical protein
MVKVENEDLDQKGVDKKTSAAIKLDRVQGLTKKNWSACISVLVSPGESSGHGPFFVVGSIFCDSSWHPTKDPLT